MAKESDKTFEDFDKKWRHMVLASATSEIGVLTKAISKPELQVSDHKKT